MCNFWLDNLKGIRMSATEVCKKCGGYGYMGSSMFEVGSQCWICKGAGFVELKVDNAKAIIFHSQTLKMLQDVREYYIGYLLKYNTELIQQLANIPQFDKFNKVDINMFTTDELAVFAETVAATIDSIVLGNDRG